MLEPSRHLQGATARHQLQPFDGDAVTSKDEAHLDVLITLTGGDQLQHTVSQEQFPSHLRLLQRASHVQVKREQASALLHGWTERPQQIQVDHGHLDLHVERMYSIQSHRATHLEEWTLLDLPVHLCL
jgi:hypothetical protein